MIADRMRGKNITGNCHGKVDHQNSVIYTAGPIVLLYSVECIIPGS